MGVKSINIKLIATSDDFTKSINCSHFQSVDPLLPPYTNITTLPPNATNRGYAGIVTENDMIILRKNPSGNISQFEKLSNGIAATNSIMNISYTSFTDMQPETEYNWLGDQGVGVKSSGDFGTSKYTSLNLKGLGVESGDPVTFNNCLTGITTEISALTVSNAKFSNLFNGIVSRYPYSQPIVIHDNVISAEETGIGLYTTDLGGYIDVRDNTIAIDETGSSGNPTFGIGMLNAMFPSNWFVCRINCNNITLDNASTGIWISGVTSSTTNKGLGVSDNNVNITDNALTTDGIFMDDVFYATLFNNRVTGSDYTNDYSTNAIRIRNTSSSSIQQNKTDGTRVGIQFEGASDNTNNILGNEMKDHFRGMELQLHGSIGTQFYTGNRWTGYDGSPEYEYLGSGNYLGAWAHDDFINFPTQLLMSQFTINGTINSVYHPYYTPTGSGWFLAGGGTNLTFSLPIGCALPVEEAELRLGLLDSLIVMDSTITAIYQEELKLVSAFHLRDKLEMIKQTDDLSGYFSSFLSGYSSTALGKLSRYRDTLMTMASIGSDSIDFVVSSDSIMHNLLSTLIEFEDDEYEINDTIINELTTIYIDLEMSWRNSLEQLIDAINTDVDDLISVVSTSNIIESNLKQAYLSFLNLLSGNECDSTIIESLEPISSQCVYEGGPGVIIARNLLGALGLHSYYDDNSLCNTERISFQSTGFIPKNYNRIHVFPNPSTGIVAVNVPQKKEDEILYIEVIDVAGKVILKERYENKLNWVDLSMFNSGTYFLKVYGQSFYGTSKIVLQQ